MGHAKQVLTKKRAALVDRNRMANHGEIGIPRRSSKGEADCVIDPAHRAYGIPHPDKVRLALGREGLLKVGCHMEIDWLLLDHANCVWDQAFIALGEKTESVQHATETAGSVCAAAEAKHVNIVAGLEHPHQELVGIRHIIGDAVAECETDDFRPPLPNAGESTSRAHRANAWMVVGDLRFVADEHLVQLDYVGILDAELIARTVA